MSLLGGCLPIELNDVPQSDCPENWGQTQKIFVTQVKDSVGVTNGFLPNKLITPTDPTLKADWDTLLALSDQGKVVVGPDISEPVSEAGAAREFGGGNATINGITINLGREPQPFESKMLAAFQEAARALKTFQKGSGTGSTSLAVYLINEAGQIAMSSNITDVADDQDELYKLTPFKVHKFFVGDKTLGGLEAPDNNMLNWEFPPNWSDSFTIITPADFDAFELVNT